ncbi:sugar ABC transporter substrate-binding protein [Spirochaetia bacterium]|nr:sugar ABC transporter substrate-binding protein [Spirochaetia bacterium]
MKKTWLLCLCLIIGHAALFAGGGKQDSSTAKPGGPVTLRFSWWGGDERHQATLKMIELYQQQNPNVKIEAEYGGFDGYYQKLVTQLAGGTSADIMQVDQPWLFELASKGEIFLNLNNNSAIDLSTFDANFLKNYCSYNGNIKGLPTGANGETLLMDGVMLQRVGINPNTVWDWDNIIREGPKVNRTKSDQYFFGLTPMQVRFQVEKYFSQIAGDVINDSKQIAFTEKQAEDVFTYFKQWFDLKIIAPFADTILYNRKAWESPDWINGNYAFARSWCSDMANYRGKRPFSVTQYPIMANPKDTGIITRPSQILCIKNDSPYKEEAAKFVNFMLNNPDGITVLGSSRGVPATTIGRETLKAKGMLDPQVEQATNNALSRIGKPQSVWQTNSEITAVMDDVVERFGYGQLTPAQAAKEFRDKLTAKLATLK